MPRQAGVEEKPMEMESKHWRVPGAPPHGWWDYGRGRGMKRGPGTGQANLSIGLRSGGEAAAINNRGVRKVSK